MRMQRKCELCSNVATIYCGSDQASLCSPCDSKVHSANFLVAKHSRTLLCHVCQSQTPWAASGAKLGPAISVCQTCLCAKTRDERGLRQRDVMNIDGGHDQDHDDVLDDDDDDQHDGDGDVDVADNDNDNLDDDDEDDDDEDDGDNQVVPWSYSVSHPR